MLPPAPRSRRISAPLCHTVLSTAHLIARPRPSSRFTPLALAPPGRTHYSGRFEVAVGEQCAEFQDGFGAGAPPGRRRVRPTNSLPGGRSAVIHNRRAKHLG